MFVITKNYCENILYYSQLSLSDLVLEQPLLNVEHK